MNSAEKLELRMLQQKVKRMEAALKKERAFSESLAASRARAMGISRARKLKRVAPRARAKGDKIRMIFGDLHGAQMERAAVEAILADVRRIDPHEIVLLGDMVNCGGFLAQHHTIGYVAEIGEQCYEEDIRATNHVLDELQAAAPRAQIHYLEGNHEQRVERWCVTETLAGARDAEFLRRQFAPEFLLQLSQRCIRYYRRGEFYHGLPVPGTIKLDKCFFWHGTSAAKHAAAANVQKIAGNVVFGHIHRKQEFQIRPVATGEICAWSVGCACRLAPLWNHTNPNDWTHGEGVQLVTPGGKFLHLSVPIIEGESLLLPLFNELK